MKLAALALSLLLLPLCQAQTSIDQLRDRLVGKPLFLRGQWSNDRLAFKADGTLHGKSHTLPLTLSGFNVESIDMKGSKLLLEGHRAGIEYQNGIPMRVAISDGLSDSPHFRKMTILIDAPAGGDLEPTLHAIFFDGQTETPPSLPISWQPYAQGHPFFLSSTATQQDTSSPSDRPSNTAHAEAVNVGPGIVPPKLTHMVDPRFNNTVRSMRFSGETVIALVVDTTGKPQDIFIRKPIGLGMDEEALQAVSQYVFQPATRDGTPVAVKIDVAVNFQIF